MMERHKGYLICPTRQVLPEQHHDQAQCDHQDDQDFRLCVWRDW